MIDDADRTQPPITVTKLVTITEGPDNEILAEIRQVHFSEFKPEVMSIIVGNLLATASQQLKNEVEKISGNIESSEYLTPVNPGALYDELVFEASVYVSGNDDIVVNTSFGRLADPKILVSKSLNHVSQVLEYLSKEFMDGNANLVPTPDTSK